MNISFQMWFSLEYFQQNNIQSENRKHSSKIQILLCNFIIYARKFFLSESTPQSNQQLDANILVI